MPLYGDIDLHANTSVVVLLNDQEQVIYQKRLPNHLPTILAPLNLGAIVEVSSSCALLPERVQTLCPPSQADAHYTIVSHIAHTRACRGRGPWR